MVYMTVPGVSSAVANVSITRAGTVEGLVGRLHQYDLTSTLKGLRGTGSSF